MRFISITNSERPEAIGDCVSAFPAVRALADREPVAVMFSSVPTRPLFSHPNVVRLYAPLSAPDNPPYEVYDVQTVARIGQARGLHLAHAWFAALGLDPPPPGALDFGVELPAHGAVSDPVIWIAPFSASDGGGQKTWPAERWAALVGAYDYGLVCGEDDALPDWCALEIPVLRGRPLRNVCMNLRAACCVVTIDNGVSWLAQAAHARHVLLQSSNHAPTWTPDLNPGAVNLPDVRQVSVAQVLAAIELVGAL